MTANYTDTDLQEEVAKHIGDTSLTYAAPYFAAALIVQVVKDTFREFSRSFPFKQREAVLTAAETKEVDISALEDWLRIDMVEYRVDRQPRSFCNHWHIRDGFILLDVPWLPIADETVYLYLDKLQRAETLEQAHVEIFIKLAAARVMLTHAIGKTDTVTRGRRVVSNYRALGQEKLVEVKADIRLLGRNKIRKEYHAGDFVDRSESYIRIS